jgi:hypothetical protein
MICLFIGPEGAFGGRHTGDFVEDSVHVFGILFGWLFLLLRVGSHLRCGFFRFPFRVVGETCCLRAFLLFCSRVWCWSLVVKSQRIRERENREMVVVRLVQGSVL